MKHLIFWLTALCLLVACNVESQSGSANTPTPVSSPVITATTPATTAPTSSPIPTQAPTATPTTASGSASGGCTNIAAFVSDVTIPDGAPMYVNVPFEKTWRIRNTGTCTWDNRYRLIALSDRLDYVSESSPAIIPVTPPGAEVNITAHVVLPPHYNFGDGEIVRGTFEMRAPDGSVFRLQPYVEVRVMLPESDAATLITQADCAATVTVIAGFEPGGWLQAAQEIPIHAGDTGFNPMAVLPAGRRMQILGAYTCFQVSGQGVQRRWRVLTEDGMDGWVDEVIWEGAEYRRVLQVSN